MDRVLIADDDPQIRTLLSRVLARAGFLVDEAPDGAEAVRLLQRGKYAVALIDLMMPRLSGYEVIDQLAGKVDRPSMVVVTAMTGVHIENLDPSVVDGIVRKPFDLELITHVVDAMAQASRARNGNGAADKKAAALPPHSKD